MIKEQLPIGPPVPNWTPRVAPSREPMVGQYCRLEALDPDRHAAELFAANQSDAVGSGWTYLSHDPFDKLADYRAWVKSVAVGDDPLFYAVVTPDGPRGVAGFLRTDTAAGSTEVGHIHFSQTLQRTRAATEAMYLMMSRVFDELGYRRYEWKCDALNAASRKAAERLGFSYEGTFRNALVYKGRNRDTAWYSIIDAEWPRIRSAMEAWLVPANFDSDGTQLNRLVV